MSHPPLLEEPPDPPLDPPDDDLDDPELLVADGPLLDLLGL